MIALVVAQPISEPQILTYNELVEFYVLLAS